VKVKGEGEGEAPTPRVTMNLQIREFGSAASVTTTCDPTDANQTYAVSNDNGTERVLAMGCFFFVPGQGFYDLDIVRPGVTAPSNVVTTESPEERPLVIMNISLNGQAHPVRNRGRLIVDTFDLTTRTSTGSLRHHA
jgi:hypothetical protein